MTPRQRLLAALSGGEVDRPPVWTHIPFVVTADGFVPRAFHGYAEFDNWRERDPAYVRLVRRMQAECDNCYIWRPPCMHHETILLPLSATRTSTSVDADGRAVTISTVSVAGASLRQVTVTQPGAGHTWTVEHVCKTPSDAERLLDIPYDGPHPGSGDFFQAQTWLGERGLICIGLPSPLLTVCRLFDPMEFLVLVRTERDLIHRLLALAAERTERNLGVLIETGVGPLFRFGGAEHATPPLMAPSDFDELVVRYDAPLTALLKRAGHRVAVHCHGSIRHALMRFSEMGVDMTDPVETLPDGDITLEEARAIAGDRMTLAGNIQVRELATLTPAGIRQRVRDLISRVGPRRLIVTTTGTPLEAIGPSLEANYHALIDETITWRQEGDS